MPTNPLPIVLSCPHGGLHVPAEVAGRLSIDETTIYNECDLWVNELFDFTGLSPDATNEAEPEAHATRGVLAQITMPIARVLVDANRPPDALDNPDGAVKSRTSYGDAIYREPLSAQEEQTMLARHWQPFHDELARALTEHVERICLFVDCHNMAQHTPDAYTKTGHARPLICLGNFGDHQGEPVPRRLPATCPGWLMRESAAVATELFGDLPLLVPDAEPPAVVGINTPFPGGYVLRAAHSTLQQRAAREVPCLFIEINRGLFVGPQTTQTPMASMNAERVDAIRRRLHRWLQRTLRLLDEGS